MAKSSRREFDAAGWLFWTLVFAVLAGPGMYLAFKFTDKGSFILLRLGAGAMIAAVGAGVISWAVNTVLQYRNRKRRVAKRKKAKKRKK